MYEFDGETCRHIDLILEAGFLGQDQQLSLEAAEQRLVTALARRAGGMRGENVLSSAHHDPVQDAAFWKQMGYRSVAYDAAGLTTAMIREHPGSAYKIVDAHMRLMRSMLQNLPEPDIDPLWSVLDDLRTR